MQALAGTFILGVGAQKAGTTWLHRTLAAHPEVYMPRIKEMHFFDELYLSDFVGDLPEKYYRGWLEKAPADTVLRADLTARAEMAGDLDRYVAFFARRKGEARAIGEITPAYSMLNAAQFCAIRQRFPDTRPVFLLRDPVDRYWSAMRMAARGRGEGVAALAARNQRNPQHLRRGAYPETLDALEAAFGARGYLTLFYEELFCPQALDTLCEFLGLSPMQADVSTRHNASPPEELPPALAAQIFAVLRPVYEGVAARLGRLPGRWHDQMARYAQVPR